MTIKNINKPNLVFVLGATDPEMIAIEKIIAENGQDFIWAEDPGGQKLTASGAYKAKLPRPSLGDDRYVLIECHIPELDASLIEHIIDHHNPGDPGFEKPASQFFEGSSIGQTIFYLAKLTGVSAASMISEEILITAASDHCPAAAYRGECKGVDPEKLMRWRAENQARYRGGSTESIIRDIEAAQQKLRSAPVLSSGVSDLGDDTISQLPEAALRLGMAYQAMVKEKSGQKKLVIGGHTTPDIINRWMEEQAALGREIYGSPVRGYAGAYIKDSVVIDAPIDTPPSRRFPS